LAKGVSIGSVITFMLILIIVSGWVNASVFYAYPHWAPLQTTSYELEAVKYIKETTQEKYIVVGDQWIIFAGQMIAGIRNPNSFYFPSTDPRGVSLFIRMRSEPTNETLIEALQYNNATVAYFVIEKPRIGAPTYSSVILQAQHNGVQTYKVFHQGSEEKLRIFCYKKS